MHESVRWWKVTIAAGDEFVIYRVLAEIPAERRALLPVEVSISWPQGELSDEVLKGRRAFESAMGVYFDSPESIMPLAIFDDQEWEWVFYVADYSVFIRGLNRSMAGVASLPLRIVYSRDPAWEYFERKIDPVKHLLNSDHAELVELSSGAVTKV